MRGRAAQAMMSVMDPDTVIAGIYAAAQGRREWSSALADMAGLLDLLFVQILGLDTRSGQLRFSSHGGPVDPQGAIDYFRFYNTIDPRVPLLMATPAEQWMHCHEHIDDAFVAKSEFYQDFLLTYNARYCSATKFITDGDLMFVLAVTRRPGQQPMGEAERPLLEQLKHHFAEAFRNMIGLRQTHSEVAMVRELLGAVPQPMLLLDETSSIWHRNEAAREMLARRDPLADVNSYLVCNHRAGQAALAEAIHSLKIVLPGSGLPRRRAVELPASDGRRVLAFVSRIDPQTAMGAFGDVARVLVILHDDAQAQAAATLRPMVVAECFGFTPAEARVAVQVANGLTIKEIAQQRRAAVATVRSQLNGAMQKAGVQRQAELVRALLTLPIR